jgi:hypothetical protein
MKRYPYIDCPACRNRDESCTRCGGCGRVRIDQAPVVIDEAHHMTAKPVSDSFSPADRAALVEFDKLPFPRATVLPSGTYIAQTAVHEGDLFGALK